MSIHRSLGSGTPATVRNLPEDPIFVQAQQQVVLDEVGIIAAAGVLNANDILNKNSATSACTMAAGAPAKTIFVGLNHSLLINRVALQGILSDITVIVTDVNGVLTAVIPLASSLTGLDSGQFLPLMAVSITILQGAASAGSAVRQLMIHKVIETTTTTTIDNAPEEPIFVQAQQQIVLEEVAITHSAGVLNHDDIFNKNSAVAACTMAAAAQTITVTLNHPLLINRVVVQGVLDDISVMVTDVTGLAHPVIPMQDSGLGLDSDNFEPVMAVTVVIIQNAASAGSAIDQLMVYKVIETKSEAMAVIPELVEFAGQKVYWDQLNTNTGGGASLKPYMLTRIPLDINADDDPAVAGTLDSTVVTTVAAAEALLITAQFHEYSRDIRKIRNYARAMVTVECGTSCRITRVSSRIGKRRVTDNTITWLTTEKFVTLNVDGAALRHVSIEHQDLVSGLIEGGWVLVWQATVLGYRTAGAIAVPATLWHSRGTTEGKLDAEIIFHASEVYA